MQKDELGDRMKGYEGVSAKRALVPELPILARIDGKRFSRFTKGMIKPFDPLMIEVMQGITKDLMERTNATAGYVQSDEITLVYRPQADPIFGGRESKLNSILASMATGILYTALVDRGCGDLIAKQPSFDCRAWSVPDLSEAVNAVIWRILDCRKNSISAVYRWKVGKATMHGKDQIAMKEGYAARYGSTWEQDFSDVERFGTLYVRTIGEFQLPDHVPAKYQTGQTYTRNYLTPYGAEAFLGLPMQDRIDLIFPPRPEALDG